MAQWERNELQTRVDWPEGRLVYASAAEQGTRGLFILKAGKAHQKGSQRKIGEAKGEVSSEHYTYHPKKGDNGKVIIKRKLRSGRSAPRKRTGPKPPPAKEATPRRKAKQAKRRAKPQDNKPDARTMPLFGFFSKK